MPKPSIRLVPGSFTLPEFYDNIFEVITAKGYDIKGIHLRTVGLKDGPKEEKAATMYDDAAFIAKETESLADDGKDVILISHSYSGIPVSESTKGLTKKERQEQGKKGGIVRLLYMTAVVPPVGSSSKDLRNAQPQEEGDSIDFGVDDRGYLYYKNSQLVADLVFSDLPDRAERLAWTDRFNVHSAVSFTNKLTHAGYKDAPVSYLLCEEDKCIPPSRQRLRIELIEKESGNKVEVTSIKAGHCPNATKPQETINWILQEAAKHEST